MSVILQPSSSFPIIRQISNHLDATVYYVRAVVRNADGDTISTVDLVSKGSQRYQTRYRVPVDSSGQGAYISIITSVYTDSGYTTKSANYGDEENTYLVFDRVLSTLKSSGGGSLDIRSIRRVIAEELEKVKPEEVEKEEKVEEPEPEDTLTPRLDTLIDTIEAIKADVAAIPRDVLDLTDIREAMQTIYSSIEDKEVTPETDLNPVYEEMDILNKEVMDELQAHRLFLQETKTDLIDTITTTVKDAVDNTEFVTDFQVKPRRTSNKSIPQPEQPAYDMSKLAS
jgi:hypothetical protein